MKTTEQPKFKEGDRVITPDGKGEIWEVSALLGFASVFIDGLVKCNIYSFDQIEYDN